MSLKPGELLNDRYKIVAVLGQGGMGSVYRARDEHLDISVAVKENLYLSDEYTRQFKREANILAQLRHPNLPRVGDYFFIKGQGQYLVMDFIEGEDLRERIERVGTLPEKEVVIIGATVCRALEYLHSRSVPVVHRDLKPGNVKISPEGEVYLVDFGLAKLMQGSQVTTTGARAMTPGYSPPEQYGTARTDHRSDVYSLGATLFAAETGAIPEDALERITGKARLTLIRSLRSRGNKRLAEVIEKSLAIEPDERYQSASEFRKALLESMGLSELPHDQFIISPPPKKDSKEIDIQKSVFVEEDEIDDLIDLPDKKISLNNTKVKKSLPFAFAGLLILTLAIVVLINPNWVQNYSNIFSFLSLPTKSVDKTTEIGASSEVAFPIMKTTNTVELITGTPISSKPTVTKTAISVSDINRIKSTPVINEVAFISDRTGEFQIWIMDENGDNEKQITSMPGGVCQPDWSPDGKKLAFISPCKDKSSFHYNDSLIYIMDYENDQIEKLPVSIEGDFDPAWSPDGDRLLFTSLRSGTSHIYLYNFSDKSFEELSDTRYADMQPSWNPSGKQIAFVREIYFYHIWIMSDKGQTQFQFSPNGAINDLWPTWASNGDLILYSKMQTSPTIPWLVGMGYEDRNTAAEYRIPQLGINDPGPVARANLSFDSKWIAFESWPDGKNHDIYRMDFDGQNQLRMTSDPGYDTDPIWRPAE